MWELTSQRQAFQAFSFDGIAQKIQRGLVTTLPRQYSPQWLALLKSMLSIDQALRPSIADLLTAPCMTHAVTQAVSRCQKVC
jgi:hypothetical protein